MLNSMGFLPNEDGTKTLMMTKVDKELIEKCVAALKPLYE